MKLLDWYDAHRRDLPWRASTDPYRVWVSEIMLQQTRVQTVLPRFERWMERFPDVRALAAAGQEDVMAEWAGLGYYGRAKRLHAAARIVAEQGFPSDRAGWLALPGIGPYTAGAIASIAFDEPVPAIDGNAVRVYARLHGIDEGGPQGRRRIEAAAVPDPDRPGDWNQAIMDLGATVCTPVPTCGVCPLAGDCVAHAKGTQAELPVTEPKRRPTETEVHFARIRRGGRVLVVPRPPDGLLAGTWMLPGGGADEALEDLVLAQTGVSVRIGEARPARHVFTHRVWKMQVHDAHIIDGEPDGTWVDLDAPAVALSTAARKAALA